MLYSFVTILIGIVSLAITVNMYIKTREKLFQYYLYFYLAFTLEVVLTAILLYISTNIPTIYTDILLLITYMATVSHYILMFAIPMFTHVLFAVVNSYIRNIIFGVIVSIMYIGHHYFVFVTNNEQLQRIGEYIEAGIFISIVLYSFVVGIYYYRTLKKNIQRQSVIWEEIINLTLRNASQRVKIFYLQVLTRYIFLRMIFILT